MLKFLESPDIQKIIKTERLTLGHWPTPLVFDNTFENFALKRDDLSGYGRAGIKTRKLEAVLDYVIKKKYKNLLLIVPNISNLRADLELFSEKAPFKVHYIISNEPKLSTHRRKEITCREQNEFKLAGGSYLSVGGTMLWKRITLLRRPGRSISLLPSVAHPCAVMGAANGLLELCAQYKEAGKNIPAHVFISSCTGCSAAGLILASAILKKEGLADIKIHTVQTFGGALRYWIWLLILWTRIKFKIRTAVRLAEIKVFFPHQEVPYGESSEALSNICKEVRSEVGIKIDPIYGARSWSALKSFADNEYKGDGLVFWHCGYTPEEDFS